MGDTSAVERTGEEMPWSEVTVQKQREEFVLLAKAEGANVSELCRRFGISRKTGNKWLSRRAANPEEALADRSRRPHSSPLLSPAVVEKAVVQMRLAHPAWGGRKIACVLERDAGLIVVPSTVTNILHRHGLVSPAASSAATAWQRFEHAEPNDLWQMDFKGHFPAGQGRCHPLTVLDDHSRYNLVLQACGNEQRQTVQTLLHRTFDHYGLPLRINADNGPPWGTAGQGALSYLGVWLIRLGIRVSYSRPAHPQTNGKEERFHRTLKAEVLAQRQFGSLHAVQAAFDHWRPIYNCVRPHEALSMQTPVQRYRPSPRSMPATLPPIEYAPDDLVRKVQSNGWISFKNQPFRLPQALTGQHVALKPRLQEDGVYDLFFCHHHIDVLNLNNL
jgi:transposase InsO family protein